MTRASFIMSFFLLFISCGKEQLITEAPSMVGTWQHYSDVDAWEIIIIKEDGLGMVKWYTNNKLYQETKEKVWYVKDNELYLGKVTFSLKPYSIETYPTTAGSTEIIDHDTLVSAGKYIVLNGYHYVEKI